MGQPVRRRATTTALLAGCLDRCRTLLDTGAPRVIVGLTGAPGAGKSTVAELLAQGLSAAGLLAGCAAMDGFHLSNAALDDLGRHGRKGAPDTFDTDGYLALLDRVRAGCEVWAPVYRRDLHEPVAAGARVAGDGVVITEGNYLALEDGPWREVRERIDLLIHLHVPPDELARRLLARHRAFGRQAADAAHWVRTVDLPNARTVEAAAARCDEVWEVADAPAAPEP